MGRGKIQPLGAEKPDFSEIVKKQDLSAQIGNTVIKEMSQSDYDIAYANGTLEAGTVYFVYGEE